MCQLAEHGEMAVTTVVLERPVGRHLENVGSTEVNCVKGYFDNVACTCTCGADMLTHSLCMSG